jgi:hypothetical protein
VPASQIKAGEELATRSGVVRVESVSAKPGTYRVYNLEVETDHCYYVGEVQVLCHNGGCAVGGPGSLWDAANASRGFDSFDRLKNFLGSPGEGNQWHHLVEQNAYNIAKFGARTIHNVDNVIPIPAELNAKLNNFYQTKNPLTGGLSPREWLQEKTLQQNYDFARAALYYVSQGIW